MNEGVEKWSIVGRDGPRIRDGDLAVVWIGMDRAHMTTVRRGGGEDSKFGRFEFDDAIGRPWGARVATRPIKGNRASASGGFVFVLRPTPELGTAGAAERRTQVIQSADIAMIVFHLELRPGARVVESGTGSGSLTRCLARAVGPTGTVHTYEFHETRAALIRRDLAAESFLAPAGSVTVHLRDACGLGFVASGAAGEDADLPPESWADAVMLDLPSPWLAVQHARRVLRDGGRIANYSPCIEQVARALEAMAAGGFRDFVTYECLPRSFKVASERVLELPDVWALLPPAAESAAADALAGADASAETPPRAKRPRVAPRMALTERAEVLATQHRGSTGHTAYLTFAWLRKDAPAEARSSAAAAVGEDPPAPADGSD